MKSVLDFQKMKDGREPISMVTCYDYTSARIVNASQVDCVLVGDSLAMVMHGHSSTLPATTELMALHTRAVALGAPDKFVVGDMPFLSYRKGLKDAMETVESLMRSGAHAVKLEGVLGHEEIVSHITGSGVPVMGHLGLTPQSIHQLGGHRVQGRDEATAESLLLQARRLEEAGCFALVLECVPAPLAKTITEHLRIPTIGIGAGSDVSGQVLVLQDLLGMNPGFKPKFLKTYLDGFETLKGALDRFAGEVKSREFPSENESYS